jgi:transcriptional regulator with XRE-family HTH domain
MRVRPVTVERLPDPGQRRSAVSSRRDAMGFAERLGELLAERHISGRELARRIPCDRSYVSLLAQGRRRPSPEMAARIDQLLGAGGELAGLAVPSAVERFPEAAEYADTRYVDELRESSQALVRLDTMYGGGDVLPLALRSFRTAAGLLSAGGCAPSAELDLQAAVGEAAEVAAWVAYDTVTGRLPSRIWSAPLRRCSPPGAGTVTCSIRSCSMPRPERVTGTIRGLC